MQYRVLTVTALVFVLATPALAVFGNGILRGNDYRVVVDSVRWGLRGSTFPVWETTSGWEADPSETDTFWFQAPEDRPLWGEFHYSVGGQDTWFLIDPIEADRWFDLPVPGGLDVAPQLMYRDSLTSGLQSRDAGPSPALFAVPNPFRTLTRLSPGDGAPAGPVRVFDPLGRQVRVLEPGSPADVPGTATWDGRDSRGLRVDAGIYIARLQTGASTRLVLLD
ncbi:MAG: hypothetical protein JSU73_06570 [candidate division WOR-3 bacterium]|nr:MAG: hypothetical protein JSU73_06570 [candidate division WOR-3 bacterium]